MKIAIVKLSAMGDIIHAMPALQFIKEDLPNIQIDWIVEESMAGVLQGNPHIRNILTLNLKALKKNKKEIINQIKRVKSFSSYKYDLVIDMQGLLKSAVVSKIIGTNCGFDKNSTREGIASWLYAQSFSIAYNENVILRNIKLLYDALEVTFGRERLNQIEPFLFFNKRDEESIVPFIQSDKKNIVYILGSSWQSKIYPKELMLQVITQLKENSLLVWGDAKEKESAKYIAQQSHAILLPKLTLGELKALISSADLVIGGDSGPTHMAWALGNASITLFGPTPAYRNTLITPKNRVLSSSSIVNPLKLNREDFSIKEIEPQSIVSLGRELLYEE